MRINELIVESQQIDELSLAGVGKGVGNVIRGTSSAVQGAKGTWQGAKDAWNQGKTAGTYDKARAAVSGIPTNQAAPTGTQPVTPPASAATTPAPTATAPTATTTPAPTTTTPAATAPVATTGRASSQQVRKEIDTAIGNVQQVRSRDRQKLVQYAQQRLATVKESSGFRSNFLGIDL